MKEMRKYIITICVALALIILILLPFARSFAPAGSPFVGSCNVATVAISGYLDSEESSSTPQSSWDISQSIRGLDLQNKKALVIFLDSDGGLPQAAEEVSAALKNVSIPTVTYVRGDALSGGYWIAASTDHIIALNTSLIGNIGVNSSFLNESASNAQQGYAFENITSGQFKNAGDADKPLTAADREFLQGVNDDLFSIFSDVVMQGRDLSTKQFAAVADGKFYVASKAKELGLIDEIGDIDTVTNYISAKTGANSSDIRFCDFPQ